MLFRSCEKPKPEITVFSGSHSLHTAAICWTHDGSSAIGTAGCSDAELNSLVTSGKEPTLDVQAGGTLGISVDSDVAAAGWAPALVLHGQAQALTSGPIHRRYWKMQFPETAASSLMGQSLTLQVVSKALNQQDLRGLWLVSLVPSENLDNA